MRSKRFTAALLALLLLVIAGCGTGTKAPETPAADPPKAEQPAPPPAPTVTKLVVGFVPSQDAGGIEAKVKPMEEFLSRELGVPVTTFVGTNFMAVIEGMGSGTVDVGWLNPLGYVLASSNHGVEILLKSVRRGSATYRAQMVVRTEDNIPVCKAGDTKCAETFAALKGKKMGFVDAASTSGYLFPASFIKNAGINLDKGQYFSDVIFAGAHDNVAKAVLNKTIDAGWTFEDIRDNLEKEIPDIKKKLSVAAYTQPIPNDTVSVRGDLPDEWKLKIRYAIMLFANFDEGKKVLKDLYTIDGLIKADDADYNVIRDMAKNMGVDIEGELKKKK